MVTRTHARAHERTNARSELLLCPRWRFSFPVYEVNLLRTTKSRGFIWEEPSRVDTVPVFAFTM